MHPRTILTVGNFFVAISATLVGYTLLSYLASFMAPQYVGFAIAGGAVLALCALPFLPNLVASRSAQSLALALAFAEMILLFAVAATPHSIASAIFVVLVISLQPLLYYTLDLMLEATIDGDGGAGRMRTFFITGANTGALVAPLLIGTLLANTENYTYIFVAAAVAIVPLVVLFAERRLPKGAPPSIYHVRDTLKHIARHRDLAAVTVGHFILYLFYIWAPFYVPIYLHGTLGIPWATLGWMFSIMLIPYVLIEYPAGWIADKVLGDKEMMFAGFIIAGSALAGIGLLTPASSLALVLMLLIATRVGAALIESMTEGHFFRRVSEKDIVSMSIFRGVWPLANVVAPLIGSMILFFGSYQLFFLLTGGFILVAGGMTALFIRDFR